MGDRAVIPCRAGGRNVRGVDACVTRVHGWTTSGGGRAFTLIEVMSVIVILALLAGLAGLSLRGVLRLAESDQATRRLLAYDEQARQRAARFDQPIRLTLRNNQIEQESIARAGVTEARNTPAVSRAPGLLPAGYGIERVVTSAGSDTQAEIVVTASAGTARSRSYGLRLVNDKGEQRWIIVCGPTGMGAVVNDDRQAQNILAILARARLPELPELSGADAD